jgi:predicted RNase H-like HicB family nuclease
MQLTVEFDRETDGRHIAEVPELRGCLVYGRTRSEAEARVRALALRILAHRIELGDRDAQTIISELLFGAA